MLILDSNILISALLPGSQKLRDFLRQKRLACSIVSKIEVLGYNKLTTDEIEAFSTIFDNSNILPLTSEIADTAIKLRQTKKMSLGDSIIAVTTLAYHAELLTADTKDFGWIENLNFTNPLV